MKYKNFSPDQIELYQNLMTCCESTEAFYFHDFPASESEDTVYRIFNYRLASYTDFCLPDALSCRGIMFEVTDDGQATRLAARPMDKFFNIAETPFAIVDDIFESPKDHIIGIDDKADGSLISSYIDHEGYLKLKTKGSIASVQAVASMQWLDDRESLYDEITEITQNAWTVNCEWCSPENRIVLPYEAGHLQILNVRNNETGEYLSREDIITQAPTVAKYLVQAKSLPQGPTSSWEETLQLIRDEVDIEGYVIKFDNGLWVKIKTDVYKKLHFCKDSITIPRRLFEACVLDAVDDLKDMFSTDTMAIKMITDMEDFVRPIYNGICARVETFVNNNKDLDRKDFAIKGKAELDNKFGEFYLAMKLYSGQEVNYTANLLKKWKTLGLSDEKTNVY